MLEQPADVPAREVRDLAVALLVEHQRLAALPQRLVHVHARAVVLEQRLRHERRRLARGVGDVLDHVLVEHELVGHAQQRVEAHVDLGLAGGAHLVVLHLDAHARLDELEHDFRAKVLQLVGRRHWEVALFVPGPEGEIGLGVLARVPDALLGVDEVVAAVRVLVETERVEDVELSLGAPIAHVGDAGAAQVLLRLPGDEACVA